MVKRLFDLAAAIGGLILLAPLFLVLGIAIKLDSRGPMFYRGERVGKDGVPFGMYKFRSMVANADRLGSALTQGRDPRITRVGRILRKCKVDELPQLINVVRGEMSLVGPRPESPQYVRHYTPEQRRVLQVRPGITGPVQVQFRHEEALLAECHNLEREYLEVIMPQKLAIDLAYLRSRSLAKDIRWMVRTASCLCHSDKQQAQGQY